MGTPRELPVEDEEGEVSEVVSVEVADENRSDARRVDPRSLECDQRGGAEVDQAGVAVGLDEDAGLQVASAAEGITASQESNSHVRHGCSQKSACAVAR